MHTILWNEGDRITDAQDDEHHVGKIEVIGVSKAFVRWHKGYATWVPIVRLEPLSKYWPEL
jgi:hypothetical protein